MNGTTISVRNWTRHEVACTPETMLSMLSEVYMSGTFGNDEPAFIRMGKGFHDTLSSRLALLNSDNFLRITDSNMEIHTFMGARVRLDERFDSWSAQVFIWDSESYLLPILFVCGTVKLVDAH